MNLALHVEPDANFDDQRRLICLRTDPPTRVRSAMTRTAPFFRQPQRDRAVFSPDAGDRHEALLRNSSLIAGWGGEKERSD
jgi:hypothetical protein